MEIDRYEPGVPSWIDIGSPSPQGAADFYGALFGWDAPEAPPETGGYRVAMVGDRAVAGIGEQQHPGPPVWSTYIAVENADEAVAKVLAAGGQLVVPAMDVLDVGRMAIFTDPQGAFFSVWQAGTHPGAQLVNEPGTWSWSELLTTDVEAAKAFYGEVFGWTANTAGDGPTGAYTEWQVNGRSVGGMMQKPPMMPAEVPPHWGVYFAVADTDAAVERVQELGGSQLMPPMDIEPGRFAVVADPFGGTFNVIALKTELAGA
jgi:predicted enzyme related to lactoylglutathione lyase